MGKSVTKDSVEMNEKIKKMQEGSNTMFSPLISSQGSKKSKRNILKYFELSGRKV
jgi:hypothetical protein